MDVILIKSPDLSNEEYTSVFDLLRSFPGPILFIHPQHQLTALDMPEDIDTSCYSQLGLEDGRDEENITNQPLSWETLFNICEQYRSRETVNAMSAVILLTKRRNICNWFSMFDERNNSFIDCADWSYFTDAHQRFPIAFQVIANLFRILMKPNMELPNSFFHDQAIGCMNDFCANKAEISLKLRTADICPVCIQDIRKKNIDERILEQMVSILEGIRLQFLFREGLGRPTKLSKITLTENNKLYLSDIGNYELKLTPLYKTLYVFYLNHLEGVRLNELSDHREELLWWYGKLSVSSSRTLMEASISALVDSVGSSFSEKKSHLNKEIERALGVALSSYYKIEGSRGEAFRVNLPQELISLPYDRTRRYA